MSMQSCSLSSVNFLLWIVMIMGAHAGHRFIGEPPSFVMPNGEPQDQVVAPDFFRMASDNTMANLILPCAVTGTPAPTIRWFRQGQELPDSIVLSDGTLVANVTEGVDATRDGVLYHCLANNEIGLDNMTAALRSRDVNVTIAFFDGFENSTVSTVRVEVFEERAVALRCDICLGNPLPQIVWMDNQGPITEQPNQDALLFLENGRYLFINQLTAEQISRQYHCVGNNSLLDGSSMRSPTTFELVAPFDPDIFIEYKPIGDVIGQVGEELRLTYVAASSGSTAIFQCDIPSREDVAASFSNRYIITVEELPTPAGDERTLGISCDYIFTEGGNTMQATAIGSIIISQAASIITPTVPEDLINREQLVGAGSVTLTCDVVGLPEPTVSWFFNGGPIPDGVSENGNEVVIAEPQVSNSGIYQCFVRNVIGMTVTADQQMWVLEVREPSPPVVQPLTGSNIMAIEDRREGTVIVAVEGTLDLVINAVVDSDPCPTVMWRFQGELIANGPIYAISNPCEVSGVFSPYNFTVTIANLTTATSGSYSATFSHLGGSTFLPPLLVTVPVPATVQSLDIAVEGSPGLSCPFSGSNVILTCALCGFPRPTVHFRRGTSVIVPGAEGFERVTNISMDQILISDMMEEDAGLYNCEAIVDGNVMPVFPTPPELQFCTLPMVTNISSTPSNPVEGDQVEISCTVEGSPMPTVMWTRNGELLSPFDRFINISFSLLNIATVTLQSAAQNDSGVYRCTATNDAGSDSEEITVIIGGKVVSSSGGMTPTDAIDTFPYIAMAIAVTVVAFVIITVLASLLIIACVYILHLRKTRLELSGGTRHEVNSGTHAIALTGNSAYAARNPQLYVLSKNDSPDYEESVYGHVI